MPQSKRQPFGNMRFRLEIDGMSESGAVEVVFPELRLTGATNDKKPVVEFGALTIRRGVTTSSEWYDWWDAARTSVSTKKRTVTVALLDSDGADAVRWKFDATRPQAYMLSPLDALGSAALIESLELAVGGFAAEFKRTRAARRRTK